MSGIVIKLEFNISLYYYIHYNDLLYTLQNSGQAVSHFALPRLEKNLCRCSWSQYMQGQSVKTVKGVSMSRKKGYWGDWACFEL